MSRATGTFEVKVVPEWNDEVAGSATLVRNALDKRFHGPLDATSIGVMVAAMTPTKGSAGYVATERVTGTLDGRRGTFVLQHNATMHRGAPQLNIVVVPDSGTEQLTGLSGSMQITAANGAHSYDFEYTIADA